MVPEFPGQTHTFFWREINELEKLGIDVRIVSTRKPKKGKSPHEWTTSAEARTRYLSPINLSILSLIKYAIFNIGGLLKCASIILKSDDTKLKERVLLFGALMYSIKLANIANQNGWQHLHSHFCYRAADIVLFASQIAKIPYSISKHGPDFSIGNQNNKWKYASFGTVITSIMLDELRSIRSPDIVGEIHIISMGVDTDFFHRLSEYSPWTPGQKLVIFCCARIDPGKGQMDLVKLGNRLSQEGEDFEIRIAGSPSKSGNPYLEEITSMATKYQLQDKILFLGALSEPEVKQQLEEAHIFVLTSRNEPLGVAYMEAMSMEVPTVANNSGGVPELIDHMKNGILCEPDNGLDLYNTVDWILKNPNEAKKIGTSGREKILKKYSSSFNARLMAKAFENATKKSNRQNLSKQES